MPRRPSKASFTSLSTRLGEIVSELHLKLVSLIQSPASSRHPEYLLALLALARTLAQNSPYSRMSRQLARPLASAVLPLLKAQGEHLDCPGSARADLARRADTQYALAATVAVSAIARNAFSQPLSSAPLLNATEIAQQALDILSGTSDADLDVEAWALLGAAASYAEGFDL